MCTFTYIILQYCFYYYQNNNCTSHLKIVRQNVNDKCLSYNDYLFKRIINISPL